MSIRDSPASQPVEIELAYRVPLPLSTSTFFSPPTHSDGYPEVSSANSVNALTSVNGSALPPTDGGFGAWSFLAAAFIVEAIVWGFPNSYGVFLDSYLQDPRFASQNRATSLLPLVGTLSSGMIYCSGGPVINPIIARYPHLRPKMMWIGAILCCGTLLGASYATKACINIFQLILLQGVLYAIGGSLLYLPCISYMSEWFVVRRGMANGILFAGTSTGGLILPLVLPPLISNYGSSKTLRILSIAIGVLLFPLIPLVKGRLSHTRTRVHGPSPRGAHDWTKNKSFCVFLAANTLQGFAYFVPIVYLPTFANSLRISRSNSAVTLSLLNGASVVGRLSMGFLTDKVNPWILALSTLFTTSATTFILWGVLSHSFAGLLAFGMLYGSVASGFTSLWTGFVRPVAKDDPELSTKLYGYLLLTRGIGNVVSTPISARLYSRVRNVTDAAHLESTGFDVGNGRFETLIIYVGTCFAGAAGVAALGWAMDVRKGKGRQR
ncbi:MFS general substrate transporter [Mycena maculata]|uniref:MFS general substrate transporter n=1 Tax=Mycena maculata TaxID=230809 RepID=A0AAD7IB17_9AGAR|nr:MFS general substrate transporter [Mycena maculata]